MKKSQLIIIVSLIWLTLSGTVACNQTSASTEARLAPTAPATDFVLYRDKIDAARAAFEAGDFEQAMTLAKEAAALNPTDNTPWAIYQEAAIAAAGDAYLRTLPDSRYRLNTEHFLADQVNGKQYFILDVREPDEYEAGHIDEAVNLPLRDLTQNLGQLPDSKSYPILIYCHSQKRATHALVILRELGYTNTFNLEGGIETYNDWTTTNPLPTPGPTATPEPEKPSC